MSYADKDYYRNTYYGTDTTDAELDKWLSRAADKIDMATQNQIDSLDDYSSIVQEYIKKANCAQAECYILNGGDSFDFDSVSIGSFSMSTQKEGSKNKGLLCDDATQYLSFTGLASRIIGSVRSCQYLEDC